MRPSLILHAPATARVLTATLLAASLAACGGGDGGGTGPEAPYAASVQISAPAAINGGESVVLTATVLDQHGSNYAVQPGEVTWKVLGHRLSIVPSGAQATVTGEYLGADSVEVTVTTTRSVPKARARLSVTAPVGALKVTVRPAHAQVRPVLVEAMDSAAARWRQVVLDRLPTTRFTAAMAAPADWCTAYKTAGVDETVDGMLVIVDEGPMGNLAGTYVCAWHAPNVPAIVWVRYNSNAAATGQSQKLADLTGVMLHELGHGLGIGAAERWKQLRSGGAFHGTNAVAALRETGTNALQPSSAFTSVPLSEEGAHWSSTELRSEVLSTSWAPILSKVSAAALKDLGWSVNMHAVDYWNPRNYNER